MNADRQPIPVNDSDRLEWAIKHPYEFREIYNWFGNADPELFKQKIDEKILKALRIAK